MLMFIVPPFFCPEAKGLFDLLDAGPAKAAAINITAPRVAIAPEKKPGFLLRRSSFR